MPALRDTWGQGSVSLRVGNDSVVLEGLSAAQVGLVRHRYGRWVDGKGRSEISVRLTRGPVPSVAGDRFQVDGAYVPEMVHSEDRVELKGVDLSGSILLGEPCRGWLHSPSEMVAVRPIVLENFLRVLSAYLALSQGGLLLHCAAIALGERALVFLGRSGAGKTTLARKALAVGVEVLSDDMAKVVRRGDGSFAIEAIPFAGELGTRQVPKHSSYRVGSVSYLEQGRSLTNQNLSKAMQLTRLLCCCPFANADPYRMERLMTTADGLLDVHEVSSLQRHRDDSFLDVVRALGC